MFFCCVCQPDLTTLSRRQQLATLADIDVLVEKETARREEIQEQIKEGNLPSAASAATDSVAQPRTSALVGGEDKSKKKKVGGRQTVIQVEETSGNAGSVQELKDCGYKGCAYEIDAQYNAY